jgi:hypothetical protein
VLQPEACIEAHLALTSARGAEIVTGDRVLDWRVPA